MTQAVPTNGFIESPANAPLAGAPPANQLPGFVAPPVAAVAAPAGAAPAAGTPNPLDASINALIAALNAQAPAAAVAAPVATADAGLNNFDVTTLEDPILRSMATVMQTVGKGLDMNRALGLAIERGDAALIDTAYLREKGGDSAEQLIVIAKGIVEAVEAQATAVTAGIHALAGGEPQWNSSVAAFNKAAPEHLRKVVAVMLDSEKKEQINAAAKLVVEYAKGSGLVPNAQGLIHNGGTASSSAQALTKEAFQIALRSLKSDDRNYQAQRGDLFARRQQGKNLGL
jgi:hypothetical protein